MKLGIKNELVVEEVNSQSGDIYRKQWGFYLQDGMEIPFLFGLGTRAPIKKGTYKLGARGFGTDNYHKLILRFPDFEELEAETANVKAA